MAEQSMREVGTTGLAISGGVVDEEYLTALRGTRWYRVVREMLDDPVAGTVIFAIEMMIRQVTWQVKPYSREPKDVKAAEFIQHSLDNMSHTWADTLTEILSMLGYGWSYLEVVYGRNDDGMINWRKWAIRGQETLERWEVGKDGGIKGMWQAGDRPGKSVFIPIEKALHFRTSSRRRNPEGVSVFRRAYRSYYIKRRLEDIEGVAIERDGTGLPIAWVPPALLAPDASAEAQETLAMFKKIVVNVRMDSQAGLVLPLAHDESGNRIYDFTLLSAPGTRPLSMEGPIQRHEARVAMAVLADFILIGHESTGSFALSTNKTDMFMTAIAAWLDSIAAVVNRFAIPQLLKLNGMSTDNPPQLMHGDVDRPNLEAIGQYLLRITSAGFVLSDRQELLDHLLRIGGLPVSDTVKPQEGKPAGKQPGVNPNAPSDATKERAKQEMELRAMRMAVGLMEGEVDNGLGA